MSDMKTASPRMPSPLTAGITVLAFYLQVVSYGYTCGQIYSWLGVLTWGHPYGGHGIMKQGVFKVDPVSPPRHLFQITFILNSLPWQLVESGPLNPCSCYRLYLYDVHLRGTHLSPQSKQREFLREILQVTMSAVECKSGSLDLY